MNGNTPELAPTLGRASDAEIMRQAVEQVRAEMEAMRRDLKDATAMRRSQDNHAPTPQPASQNGLTKWLPTINVVLGIMLTVGAGGMLSYKGKVDDGLTAIAAQEREIVGLRADLKAERATREAYQTALEIDRQRFRLVDDAVTRNTADIKAQDQKLSTGKEDRVRDIGTLNESMTGVRLELNSLKVELGFVRRALEGAPREQGSARRNQYYEDAPVDPRFPFVWRVTDLAAGFALRALR